MALPCITMSHKCISQCYPPLAFLGQQLWKTNICFACVYWWWLAGKNIWKNVSWIFGKYLWAREYTHTFINIQHYSLLTHTVHIHAHTYTCLHSHTHINMLIRIPLCLFKNQATFEQRRFEKIRKKFKSHLCFVEFVRNPFGKGIDLSSGK